MQRSLDIRREFERIVQRRLHARERQTERVDRKSASLDSDRQIAAFEEPGQALVAAAQVEDERARLVLLKVRQQEVEEETLPAARGSENEGMRVVLVVEVEKIGSARLALKDRQVLGAQMGVLEVSGALRKEKAQVGVVGVQEPEPRRL